MIVKQYPIDEQLKSKLSAQGVVISREVKERIDLTLRSLPEQSIHTNPRRLSRFRIAWISIAAACCMVVFSVFAMNQSTFADQVKPWIQSIFGWMGDKGLSSNPVSQPHRSELPVLVEKEDQGYILRVHEASFDGMRLSFSYSLGKTDGELPKETFAIPSFQLDDSIRKLDPQVVKSDSSAPLDSEKVGIVNYFFTAEIPDQLHLLVHVPEIVLTDGLPTGQSVKRGDWGFALEIARSGTGVQKSNRAAYTHEWNKISIGVDRIRQSAHAAEWHVNLKLPRSKVDEVMRLDRVRYGLKYNIVLPSGMLLASVTETGSSRIEDRTLPRAQWMHEEQRRIWTEPVPAGVALVKIVPVLMTFNGEASTEKELTSLQVEVPLD